MKRLNLFWIRFYSFVDYNATEEFYFVSSELCVPLDWLSSMLSFSLNFQDVHQGVFLEQLHHLYRCSIYYQYNLLKHSLIALWKIAGLIFNSNGILLYSYFPLFTVNAFIQYPFHSFLFGVNQMLGLELKNIYDLSIVLICKKSRTLASDHSKFVL